ncbi:MAG TPA: hypothetical protein VFA20_08970 [Myxococcaceae bacterium]|nr:hypothetical protein [Myxococcaceae bacterium]
MRIPRIWLVVAAISSCRHAAPAPEQPEAASSPEMSRELRDMILHGSRAKFDLPASKDPVWGVVMDWGLPNGTVTMVAIVDGNASYYLSTGGGAIGGGGQPPVRQAAIQAVAAAGEVVSRAKATSQYPLAGPGQVTFYLLTDSGVLAVGATDKELDDERHPLSKLYGACQEVLTQFRLLDESGQ